MTKEEKILQELMDIIIYDVAAELAKIEENVTLEDVQLTVSVPAELLLAVGKTCEEFKLGAEPSANLLQMFMSQMISIGFSAETVRITNNFSKGGKNVSRTN